MIWKIEVSLVHPDPGKKYFYWKGNKAFSTDDANAVRMYRLYIGTDVYNIISNPDWEVSQFLEKLTLGAEDIQRN